MHRQTILETNEDVYFHELDTMIDNHYINDVLIAVGDDISSFFRKDVEIESRRHHHREYRLEYFFFTKNEMSDIIIQLKQLKSFRFLHPEAIKSIDEIINKLKTTTPNE